MTDIREIPETSPKGSNRSDQSIASKVSSLADKVLVDDNDQVDPALARSAPNLLRNKSGGSSSDGGKNPYCLRHPGTCCLHSKRGVTGINGVGRSGNGLGGRVQGDTFADPVNSSKVAQRAHRKSAKTGLCCCGGGSASTSDHKSWDRVESISTQPPRQSRYRESEKTGLCCFGPKEVKTKKIQLQASPVPIYQEEVRGHKSTGCCNFGTKGSNRQRVEVSLTPPSYPAPERSSHERSSHDRSRWCCPVRQTRKVANIAPGSGLQGSLTPLETFRFTPAGLDIVCPYCGKQSTRP